MLKSSKKKNETAPVVEAAIDETDWIAKTAYYLAEQRGFEPGFELDDWCTAEKIRAGQA